MTQITAARDVPGHGEVRDVVLVAKERTYLKAVQSRVLELKAQGKSSDEEARLLSAEFRGQYPDWDNPDWISDAVRRFYSESR